MFLEADKRVHSALNVSCDRNCQLQLSKMVPDPADSKGKLKRKKARNSKLAQAKLKGKQNATMQDLKTRLVISE